jgi:hypothetical protein
MTKGKTMLDFTLTEEQCNIRDLAHDFAAAIVLGSRGLTGVRSMLLGSVPRAVVQHADRATLVIHRRNDEHAAPDQPT